MTDRAETRPLSTAGSGGNQAALCAWTAAVLGYGAMLAAGGRLLNDPDTYWHIAAGRWMIEHRMVPDRDPFSYTFQGAPWVPHEWLAELVLAVAHGGAGWGGVIGVTALAMAASLGLLTWFLSRSLAPRYALVLAMMALFVASPHLLARPHVFAMPAMIAWVGGLALQQEKSGLPPWALLPVMVLWANLHGGYSLGLVMAGLFALEAVLAAEAADRLRVAISWAGFLLLSVGAALLTPNGVEGLFFPVHLLGMKASLAAISEWRSPDFQRFQPIEFWLLGLLLMAFISGLRLPPLRAIMLLLLAHLALAHERSAELLGLLAPLIMASSVARQFGSPPLRPSGSWIIPGVVGATLMIGATSLFLAAGDMRRSSDIAPEAALQEVAGKVSGNIFNAYDFGGYLIFKGTPPFIDGRVDLYGDEFFGDYRQAVDGVGDALPRLLERRRIDWTLLPPQSPAVALLDLLPGWERIYRDGTAVVHRRSGP